MLYKKVTVAHGKNIFYGDTAKYNSDFKSSIKMYDNNNNNNNNNNNLYIWFGDTVTVSHSTKCDTNSKVRALSWVC